MFNSIKRNICTDIRNYYLKSKRKKLKNTNFSLISSNCNGATILHDLGLRFNSPFVNLWIKPKDYLKMLGDLENYMKCKLFFIDEPGITYPVALLNDIHIYFQHYKTKEEAETKWNERVKRINYDNIYVLFTDRDGCTFEDLITFDNLDYKNKVVFVNKNLPDIKSSVYIKGFDNEESVGNCMYYQGKYAYKKYYDQFDYVSWFNSGN